jgi:anti-sigma regulatory factor (Ser/Thr protein kinase)
MMANQATLDLPSSPTSARLARTFVVGCWSDFVRSELLDAIALCVSELVTNALDHAMPPYELRVARSLGRLRVEVADASARMPVLQPLSLTALRGRGIYLVERTATCWGVEPTTAGKTVWAEFVP